MNKYIGEFTGIGIAIFLVIIAIILVALLGNGQQGTMCIKGYLFTTTRCPTQILDSNKTPITCEGK